MRAAYWPKTAISADTKSIRCMRPRSNASARERREPIRVRRQGERRQPSEAPPAGSRRPHCGPSRQSLRRPTLAKVIPAIEALVGNVLDRIVADAGYRGHNAPPDYKFKVYTAGQKRRVTEQIKRDFKRRAAIEPVIGHLKDDHRMGRNYLAHSSGDAINAVLAAAAYNFRRLIAWLRLLLLRILLFFSPVVQLRSA